MIATRDRPELLERAVSAVLGQDYPGPVECAIVFDQSAPRAIPADEPAGRELRILTNERTPGLAGARNTGITGTGMPLIAFCDDDDAWTPGKLRAQVELMRAAEAEFVAGGVRIHHGEQTVTRIPPVSVPYSQLVRERVGALHPSTFMFRRDVLDGLGLVDEEIPGSYGEDYDWLLRAARRMPIVSVQHPVADIYWHPQSYFAERWDTVERALEYLLTKHPALVADAAGRSRILGQIAFAQAARAHRSPAVRSGWHALRGNPAERRAYLAIAVAAGLVPATTIIRLANSKGRGI